VDALTNPSLQTENENALLAAVESRFESLLLSTDAASPFFTQPTAVEPEPGPAVGLSGAFSS
jgi:hypothetical protein